MDTSEHSCSGRGLGLNVYRSRVGRRRQLWYSRGVDVPGEGSRGAARPDGAGDVDLTDLDSGGCSRRDEGRNTRTAAGYCIQCATRAPEAGSRGSYGTGRNTVTGAVGQGRGPVRYPRPQADTATARLYDPRGSNRACCAAGIGRRVGQERKINCRPSRHGHSERLRHRSA
jgi:hypothetical protein